MTAYRVTLRNTAFADVFVDAGSPEAAHLAAFEEMNGPGVLVSPDDYELGSEWDLDPELGIGEQVTECTEVVAVAGDQAS